MHLLRLLPIAIASLSVSPGDIYAQEHGADASAALSLREARADERTRNQAEGLARDVERIVAIEQSTGWFIDKREQEDILPTVLESVCRAPRSARSLAIELLRVRQQRLGDPRQLFAQAGHEMTSEVADALSAQRSFRALQQALEVANDQCPFWVLPDPSFQGRQTDRNRFTLSLETGGLAQLRQTAGFWTFGGGGTARLLPGYGIAGKATVLAGAEFGGGAMLEPGGPQTEFVINYFTALPLVARFHGKQWQYEIEGAPVALFQSDDTSLSYGVRGGIALGLAGLRARSFLPWAGAHVAYEYYFEGSRPAAHFVRGGIRIGIVWDPQ